MVHSPEECNPAQLFATNECEGVEHATVVDIEPKLNHVMASIIEGLEPSYEEVQNCPDWPRWEEAIKKELAGLEKMGTWRLVKRPPDVNIVDTKWVFWIKKNSAGEVEKYKARLVARGFTQI